MPQSSVRYPGYHASWGSSKCLDDEWHSKVLWASCSRHCCLQHLASHRLGGTGTLGHCLAVLYLVSRQCPRSVSHRRTRWEAWRPGAVPPLQHPHRNGMVSSRHIPPAAFTGWHFVGSRHSRHSTRMLPQAQHAAWETLTKPEAKVWKPAPTWCGVLEPCMW